MPLPVKDTNSQSTNHQHWNAGTSRRPAWSRFRAGPAKAGAAIGRHHDQTAAALFRNLHQRACRRAPWDVDDLDRHPAPSASRRISARDAGDGTRHPRSNARTVQGQAQHEPQRIVSDLLNADINEKLG